MEKFVQIQLKLYILESSQKSQSTINRLKNFLGECLESYNLDIIDIIKNPALTIQDEVLASPTLIKVTPLPLKRLAGKLLVKDLIEKLGLGPYKKNDCGKHLN